MASSRILSLAVAGPLLLLACGGGTSSSQGPVVAGSECATASDCRGPLPMSCLLCADGSAGCAHYVCDQGRCEVAYCPQQPAPDGGSADGGAACPSGLVQAGCACCPSCVQYGCMLPCMVLPGCP